MSRNRLIGRYGFIVFALMMLIVSWEYQATQIVLAQSHIPEESIRLRILAHSDSPRDQWIKLKVRDEIVHHMREWVTDPQTIDDARAEVEHYVQAFEQLVGEVLQQYGFTYSFSVELAIVDFPTKIYGSKRYPAGDYEALRVVLGNGKGENWWCVLFPPLCFVDLTTSVTVKEQPVQAESYQNNSYDAESSGDLEIEKRSFIWDGLKKVGVFFKSLFQSKS